MSCPGIDRLIAHGLDQQTDAGLEAHLQRCEACRADLLTIKALAGAEIEEKEISEALVARIISGLPEPEGSPKLKWGEGFQLFLTGVLGTLTALISLVVSGSIGSVGPSGSLLLGIGFGAICTLMSLHWTPGAYPLNGEPARPDPA